MQSHDFRTTKINELIKEIGLKQTQHYVGHKKESTTLRYAKCSANDGYDAVANATKMKTIGNKNLLGKRTN